MLIILSNASLRRGLRWHASPHKHSVDPCGRWCASEEASTAITAYSNNREKSQQRTANAATLGHSDVEVIRDVEQENLRGLIV